MTIPHDAGDRRDPRDDAPTEPSERAERALRAARTALEQDNWDAAVLAAGTALREVARSHLVYNEQKGDLPQLLDRLSKQLAGEPPLAELAAALRPNGPLRGVFSLDHEVDGEVAAAALALVDDLLVHVYGVRTKLRRLEALLTAADARGAGEAEPRDAAPGFVPAPRASGGTPRVPSTPHVSGGEGSSSAPGRDAFESFDSDPLGERWEES